MAKIFQTPLLAADLDAHGPLPVQRISRSDYTRDFLDGLQHRKQVVATLLKLGTVTR